MKTILIGSTEIVVTSFNAYVYTNGRGEKVLQFKVPANNADFDFLRATFENNEQPIKYMEDNILVCEYVGYGVFEALYSDGIYDVELHKTTITEQMNALLNANERLLTANDTHQRTINMLVEQNEILAEQNVMLEFTMAELMEVTIPSLMDELMLASAAHDEALAAQGELLSAVDERLQFVEAVVTAGDEVAEEETIEPVTE